MVLFDFGIHVVHIAGRFNIGTDQLPHRLWWQRKGLSLWPSSARRGCIFLPFSNTWWLYATFKRWKFHPALSPSFHSPHMAVLLRGIIQHQSQNGTPPSDLSLLAQHSIKSVLAQKAPTNYNILIWAACCVGFFQVLMWEDRSELSSPQHSYVHGRYLAQFIHKRFEASNS